VRATDASTGSETSTGKDTNIARNPLEFSDETYKLIAAVAATVAAVQAELQPLFDESRDFAFGLKNGSCPCLLVF
jgi:hypothetical protein